MRDNLDIDIAMYFSTVDLTRYYFGEVEICGKFEALAATGRIANVGTS